MDNKNKPAFSVALKDNGNAYHKEAMGLTKREYFAGLAMQGLMTTLIPLDNNQICPNLENVKYCVDMAVTAADELLRALETTEC